MSHAIRTSFFRRLRGWIMGRTMIPRLAPWATFFRRSAADAYDTWPRLFGVIRFRP
jgi:hypothetical protein